MFLIIGCKTKSTNKNTTKDIVLNNHLIKVENTEPTEEPYTIKFLSETTANNETFLVIEMELNNDSHFV